MLVLIKSDVVKRLVISFLSLYSAAIFTSNLFCEHYFKRSVFERLLCLPIRDNLVSSVLRNFSTMILDPSWVLARSYQFKFPKMVTYIKKNSMTIWS